MFCDVTFDFVHTVNKSGLCKSIAVLLSTDFVIMIPLNFSKGVFVIGISSK